MESEKDWNWKKKEMESEKDWNWKKRKWNMENGIIVVEYGSRERFRNDS